MEYSKLKKNIEDQEKRIPESNIFGQKLNEKAHIKAMSKVQKQNYMMRQL
jgi:hypothetical protein